jgi:hypothetical protein
MLVVSDLEDVFLPRTSDLLVNIVESRKALESMLAGLNTMFQDAYSPNSALGPALQAAFQLAVRLILVSEQPRTIHIILHPADVTACELVPTLSFSPRWVGRSSRSRRLFLLMDPERSRTETTPRPSERTRSVFPFLRVS